MAVNLSIKNDTPKLNMGVSGVKAAQAAKISIGTVSSGAEAAVTNSGTIFDAVLDFVLPKGDTGDTGPQGPPGDTGAVNTLSIGTVTSGDDADASISGTAPNQVLNLQLPKGDKGEKGEKGDPGDAGASIVVFQNTAVPASAWEPDGTYGDYPYRAAVPLDGVTTASTPDVIFGEERAAYHSYAIPYAGGIYIYANDPPNESITIPTILIYQ